jgi:hypothetical protein
VERWTYDAGEARLKDYHVGSLTLPTPYRGWHVVPLVLEDSTGLEKRHQPVTCEWQKSAEIETAEFHRCRGASAPLNQPLREMCL